MASQTRPRVPIAAMFRGPGPGAYGLAGSTGYKLHDATKRMNPAFSFGLRTLVVQTSYTPSPAAYSLQKGTTRRGADGSYKYTFKGRTKLGGSFQTPAAWDYSPEKHAVMKHTTQPIYSFGSRTALGKRDNYPGPDSYTLPPMTGGKAVGKTSAASYSMTGRSKIGSFHEDLQKTPGAGTYKVVDPNITKGRKPTYSMNGRNFAPGDNTLKPGPGAYSPERNWTQKKQAPRFSFGIRHSEWIAPLITDPID